METETDQTHAPLKFFEIWKIIILHPTVKTFSRISNDPKASAIRGVIWMAIASVIVWYVGPQREILSGYAADTFGLYPYSRFLLIGAFVAPVLGVISLFVNAAIAHGLAHIFKGTGTFHQLVYCWAVTQLPFFLILGLIRLILSIFPSSREFAFSTAGVIYSILLLLVNLGVVLYLLYAEVVAYSAVEGFEISKGFGILILQAIIFAIAGACLSFVTQSIMMNSFRY
jgi:hypothetical protein